jgi:hypothetical protein
MAYSDGARYEGSWCHGIIHGHGKYQWPIDSGGGVYEGDFKKNEKHGKGIMRQADGKLWYDGEYKQGIPHGYGTLYIIQMVPSTKVHGRMGKGMALERIGIAMDMYTKESGHKIRRMGKGL